MCKATSASAVVPARWPIAHPTPEQLKLRHREGEELAQSDQQLRGPRMLVQPVGRELMALTLVKEGADTATRVQCTDVGGEGRQAPEGTTHPRCTALCGHPAQGGTLRPGWKGCPTPIPGVRAWGLALLLQGLAAAGSAAACSTGFRNGSPSVPGTLARPGVLSVPRMCACGVWRSSGRRAPVWSEGLCVCGPPRPCDHHLSRGCLLPAEASVFTLVPSAAPAPAAPSSWTSSGRGGREA